MVPVESFTYTVFFEERFQNLQHFLEEQTYSRVFILTDENTGKYCLPILQSAIPSNVKYDLIEVLAGEENKTIDFCIGIWKMLLDFGADRNSLLINLGGGVITDMGGFAASTFKRGIDFVQVPTTLLSQVDASIGGKTGVDLDSVKNIVGTFTQPKAVFVYPPFIETLDRRQLISGFAEMVKHGLIRDSAYFHKLKSFRPDKLNSEWIRRSIEIKNEIVQADPTEQSLRKILNFGHTLGHAIEIYSLDHDANPLLHGEAIAIGMVCEAFLSHRLCGLSTDALDEISTYIRSVFPYYSYQSDIYSDLFQIMKNDKKNIKGKISFSLLERLGNCQFDLYPEEELIVEALDYYRNLN